MSDAIQAYDPAVDAPAHHHPIYDYDSGPPVDRGKFAIWLFLGTEVMFFTGLIGTYIVLRTGSATWPNPDERLAVGITAVNTFILITSSWSMVKALHAIQNGDRKGMIAWLGATIVGGSTSFDFRAEEPGTYRVDVTVTDGTMAKSSRPLPPPAFSKPSSMKGR